MIQDSLGKAKDAPAARQEHDHRTGCRARLRRLTYEYVFRCSYESRAVTPLDRHRGRGRRDTLPRARRRDPLPHRLHAARRRRDLRRRPRRWRRHERVQRVAPPRRAARSPARPPSTRRQDRCFYAPDDEHIRQLLDITREHVAHDDALARAAMTTKAFDLPLIIPRGADCGGCVERAPDRDRSVFKACTR